MRTRWIRRKWIKQKVPKTIKESNEIVDLNEVLSTGKMGKPILWHNKAYYELSYDVGSKLLMIEMTVVEAKQTTDELTKKAKEGE